MGRLWIAFLVGTLVLGLLSGCAPGESNKVNCSAGGEVCITLQMDDFFKAADPVKVEITVTSKIDIADLYVGLRYDPRIILEVPETWENFVSPAYEGAGLSGWFVKIKAGEKLTFTRTLYFPAETGWYSVGARFNHNIPPYVGSEGVSILILDEKGQVIGYGTPIPVYTPEDKSQEYWWADMTPTACCKQTETSAQPATPTAETGAPRDATAYPPPTPYP